MMVSCNDIVVIEHDRRGPGLPNAPVIMGLYNNKTEEYNSKHNVSILTYLADSSVMPSG